MPEPELPRLLESATAWEDRSAESLLDDIRAAIEAVSNPDHPMNQPHPCGLGMHMISLNTKERGYGICHTCGAPVGTWPSRGREDD